MSSGHPCRMRSPFSRRMSSSASSTCPRLPGPRRSGDAMATPAQQPQHQHQQPPCRATRSQATADARRTCAWCLSPAALLSPRIPSSWATRLMKQPRPVLPRGRPLSFLPSSSSQHQCLPTAAIQPTPSLPGPPCCRRMTSVASASKLSSSRQWRPGKHLCCLRPLHPGPSLAPCPWLGRKAKAASAAATSGSRSSCWRWME